MSDARVALVTGGGTGIGTACCRALAAEGFRVAIHYRSSEASAQALAGRPILVNSVAPGFIDTGMTASLPAEARERILDRIPLGRMGTPEEVADAVAWLATRAGYVNGSVLHVNGGLYTG